jgi:hypothetical protein
MKKMLAVIILGLGLSGCAGMELTSVSVSAGHHYPHYYPRHYYTPPVVYRRPVIVQHNHTVVRPHQNHRRHDRRDHRRDDRRRDRRDHRDRRNRN